MNKIEAAYMGKNKKRTSFYEGFLLVFYYVHVAVFYICVQCFEVLHKALYKCFFIIITRLTLFCVLQQLADNSSLLFSVLESQEVSSFASRELVSTVISPGCPGVSIS